MLYTKVTSSKIAELGWNAAAVRKTYGSHTSLIYAYFSNRTGAFRFFFTDPLLAGSTRTILITVAYGGTLPLVTNFTICAVDLA
jgi:hypothetical protein